MINEVKDNEVLFAKVKEGAIIPSKRNCDAGYDIYACFDEECMEIPPHTTKMIPTGICSAFSEDYVMILKERSSTGTKGIAQRCGIIDSGFRGEWKVPITNTTDKILHIDKNCIDAHVYQYDIIYPYTKAICQTLLLPVPKVEVKEITLEELKAIPSERGETCLGQSGK